MSTSEDESLEERREREKSEKEEKMKEFREEVIEILSLSPKFEMEIAKFIPMYEKKLGSQIDVRDYGFDNVTHLFMSMGETVTFSYIHVPISPFEPCRGAHIELTESIQREVTAKRDEMLKNHPKLLQFEKELVQLRDTLQGRGKIITVAEFPTYFWRHFGRTLKGPSINDVR